MSSQKRRAHSQASRSLSSPASLQSHSEFQWRALEQEALDRDKSPFRAIKSSSNSIQLSAAKMPQQDGASREGEGFDPSSPAFRGMLKAHRILIDNTGEFIPPDVRVVVNKYMRRPCLVSGEEGWKTYVRNIEAEFHGDEISLSRAVPEPHFVTSTCTAAGGGTVWDSLGVPRDLSREYLLPIPPPKTTRHFGFPTALTSNWDLAELAVADHPLVRSFFQPASGNMFPSYLREVRSEARGGTLYEAESQLAVAGAHRIKSWLWMLGQADPMREQSCADAVVFSDAITQRQGVAYVHYYDLDSGYYTMSCIDEFSWRTDMLRFQNHINNVMSWLVTVQQPLARSALRGMQPVVKRVNAERAASSDATGK